MQSSVLKEQWTLWQKLLFRFFASYFLIYLLPFPIGYIPFTDTINRWYHRAFDAFISFAGKHIFHIPFPLFSVTNGSGDTSYNYVQLFLFVVLAFVATTIWSVADKKGRNSNAVLYVLMIYLRYYFAFSMMKYGFDKIIKVQFPFPFYSLDQTYGESSPMRLMWNFMGFSTAYNIFTGWLELAAGFLVLFRRTTMLGALLGATILTNVVVLNLCFDVPVKLHAANLLLITLFILAPDAKRLFHFFIGNKAVPAVNTNYFLFSNPRLRYVVLIAKFVFILYFGYTNVAHAKARYAVSGDGAFKKTPLFGVYEVEQFVKNNDTLLPLLTDTVRWKTLNIYLPREASVKMMNDERKNYFFLTDTVNKKIELYSKNDSLHKTSFSYTVIDTAHLSLSGIWKGDSVLILLRKKDKKQFELLNRDFHWINESPYKK